MDLARGDPGARAAAQAAEASAEALLVPSPALARFLEGVERSRRPVRDAGALRDHLLGVPTIPFAAQHATVAARLLARSVADEAPLDPFDAMVAAIAIVEEQPLLTRNARDFERIADVRIRTY